jgi:hypothetical protein
MNAKQVKEAKRGVAMITYAEARVEDFTHTPAKPVDAKHAATIVKGNTAITGLGGKVAIQQAGEHGEKTEILRGDREEADTMLHKINGTMASVAEEKKQPELMDRFRMPHGNGDNETAAKLTAFANAIDELGLLDELEAHNLIVTTDDLREMADDLKDDGGDQALARGKKTGATASIPDHLKALRECKKTLDAIYQNTYDGNTEMLTAWRSVSHLPRGKDGADESAPPAPPAPPA